MQATQLELPVKTTAPQFTAAEVELIFKILREAKGWLSAREISAQLPEDCGGDRHVRAVASACVPRIVSFPGSPGYKLWEFCSLEEINHCIESFEHQGKEMLKRSFVYRQAYHRRFRGQTS